MSLYKSVWYMSGPPYVKCRYRQVPELVCGAGQFRCMLERVPLLSEAYWPTPWCVEARLQTVLGSLLRSRWLPPVTFRRYARTDRRPAGMPDTAPAHASSVSRYLIVENAAYLTTY